ncbi:MalY/PatB family protein [Actinoplanes regularis]|uniref:cysteine-S-conjugate beta-lyase n=1 Tax=Actinoplanes regularis TaxID=52697 RepID=A0A239J0K8_9ACTN|nr:MalY/PatB family protein [Actinoplanes regularis]GIE91922.1 putative cystathionine beta-lyase [Actinoplanes regularis]SNS99441.1 cystathione beta-lyase [Actinoplanes regularis]
MSGVNPLEELTLARLRSRTSLKWTTHPPDVLPLWVAEMDVRLAPAVAVALREAIDAGDTGYPSGHGYADALARFAADRWGWGGITTGRTAVVPDVMMGIVEALRLVTEPGDAVIVCPPVYPPFYAFLAHAGRRVVEAPLGPGWRLDLDVIETVAARHRAKALLLCSPHNPTGVVHTSAELTALAALARRHDIRVISDEIHAPLVLSGARFVPYLSVPGAENAFALLSASKGWNLAGLKAALLVAGPDATADLARLPEEVGHGPSHLGVLAHTAAFAHGRAWLDDLLEGLDRQRDLLGSLVAEHLPQTSLVRPQATYLGWLDCRALGLHTGDGAGVVTDLDGPARLFLDRARVALSSGHVFGSGGAGFVRINFATSEAILREALRRMGAAASGAPAPRGTDTRERAEPARRRT